MKKIGNDIIVRSDKAALLYEEKNFKTARGEAVRSKSEVIIADQLSCLGVEYIYEHPFAILGLKFCPDFTMEEIESGRIFYWEHNRFFHIVGFKKLWERQLDSYRAVGILPYENGGGENGTLIVTSDSHQSKISSREIECIIRVVILEQYSQIRIGF